MAGRPKGSTNLPKIRDYIDKDQIEKLVRLSLKKAMEGDDTTMQRFLLEQIFGKAPQPLIGDKDNPLITNYTDEQIKTIADRVRGDGKSPS